MDSPRLLTAGLQSNSVCDQTTTEKPLRPDTELRIRRICDSSACWASESESGRNHNMLGRSPRLLHVSSEGKKRRGDARTRRRGDAETRGREDGATRGRGDGGSCSPCLRVSVSPRLRVTASPCLRVSLSSNASL